MSAPDRDEDAPSNMHDALVKSLWLYCGVNGVQMRLNTCTCSPKYVMLSCTKLSRDLLYHEAAVDPWVGLGTVVL